MNRPVSVAPPAPNAIQHNPALASRNPALDGLRGIAVLAVLVYHFWPGFLPGGFLGVDLFFVLSGFLITGGLLRQTAAGRIPDLRGFWVRRCRRLLPGMLLVLVVSTALALLAAGHLPAGLRWQWAGALTYTSNWMQIAHGNSYFSSMEPPYFQHLWSLAVEEQFYLLWPVVLAGLSWLLRTRRKLLWGILVLAAASAASMAWGFDPSTDPSALYYGTWTHGFGLFLGAAGAVHGARSGHTADSAPPRAGLPARLSQVPMLLALLAAFCVLSDTSAAAYQGGMAIFCVLGTVLILTLKAPGTLVYSLLSLKYLRWLGCRSYGLYLWHWPLLMLATAVFPPQAATAAVLCTIPLVVSAAAVSWRFVEEPILRHGFKNTCAGWARWMTSRIGLVRQGAAGSVASALVLLLVLLVPACAMSVLLASPGQSQLEQQLARAQDALAKQEPSLPEAGQESAAPSITEPGKQTKAAPQAERGTRNFTGSDVTALGDSVMLASSQQLLKQLPGITIEASVGAQIWDAPARLRQLENAGKLRKVIVLGLGTNGDVPAGTLEDIREIIGPRRELLLVTAYAPRKWIDSVNAKLRAAASSDRRTHLVDWAGSASEVADFAPDRIHPGPHGSETYGELLADTVAEL
ncbi:acetyltransferase [Glutamicibacter sp. MNS18]|uniref:acyltransferase family protein n=1 Tax=Glutamicibacter sp. MNS18 TaxID=2989817 RepID=UPI002235B036|nr:acyltransferase family protein [Glutamicibacter sp. MNS18]MCW4466762.1 acetyltransferase [Glutamicibacter sp. MNS18]